MPRLAINNWLSFKGRRSDDMGIIIRELYNPVLSDMNGEEKHISGRDGSVWITDGSYKDADVKITMEIPATTRMTDVFAWLSGFGELIFSDDPFKAFTARVTKKAEAKRGRYYNGKFRMDVTFTVHPYVTDLRRAYTYITKRAIKGYDDLYGVRGVGTTIPSNTKIYISRQEDVNGLTYGFGNANSLSGGHWWVLLSQDNVQLDTSGDNNRFKYTYQYSDDNKDPSLPPHYIYLPQGGNIQAYPTIRITASPRSNLSIDPGDVPSIQLVINGIYTLVLEEVDGNITLDCNTMTAFKTVTNPGGDEALEYRNDRVYQMSSDDDGIWAALDQYDGINIIEWRSWGMDVSKIEIDPMWRWR